MILIISIEIQFLNFWSILKVESNLNSKLSPAVKYSMLKYFGVNSIENINGIEARGRICEIFVAGYGSEDATARGWLLVKGGGGKRSAGGGGKTSQDLHWQYTGNSGIVGGLKAYLRGMHKGGGIWWWGKAPGAVVAAGGSWTTAGGHVKRHFGGSKGAVATVIWKVCRGRVWGRIIELCKWRLRGRRAKVFQYPGIETGDARVGGWSRVDTRLWMVRRLRSVLPPPEVHQTAIR